MHERLFKLYQRRRVINVNVNVTVAGLLAITLTLIPVHLTRHLDIQSPIAITVIAGVCDIFFDVMIFYALHWIANHWKPFKPRSEAEQRHHDAKPPPFIRDATLLQFERALLSPVYYVVALSAKYGLLKLGWEREWALVVGFIIGIVVTRVAHTAWGLRSGTFRDNCARMLERQEKADTAA